MTKLKRLGVTMGIIVVTLLSLVGLLSLTRGTPMNRVAYSARDGAPKVHDSTFRDLIALSTGMHLEPGNVVEQLLNGDGTYPRLWQDLRSAQRSITMQMYYAKPGAVADTLLAVLSERARAGVRVLLLLDAFGSQSLKEEWGKRLEQAGEQRGAHDAARWTRRRSGCRRRACPGSRRPPAPCRRGSPGGSP